MTSSIGHIYTICTILNTHHHTHMHYIIVCIDVCIIGMYSYWSTRIVHSWLHYKCSIHHCTRTLSTGPHTLGKCYCICTSSMAVHISHNSHPPGYTRLHTPSIYHHLSNTCTPASRTQSSICHLLTTHTPSSMYYTCGDYSRWSSVG